MRRILRSLLRVQCLLTAALLLPSLGRADTIYLRNGEQQAGSLTRMTERSLWFESDGEVSEFPKTEVLKIQLQRAREFDDVDSADEVTDPDLRRCLENQPGGNDYPAAGYVTLLERSTYDLTEPGVVRQTERRIVKVLRQRGEEAASQIIPYFEDADSPRIDFALTVTPDGRVLHLDDAALKNESLFSRFPAYQRLARFRFACKEPRPGSLLDIQFSVVRKRPTPVESFYAEEYFRNDQPLLRKEVFVLPPSGNAGAVNWWLSGPDAVAYTKEALADGAVRLAWRLREPQRGIVPEPLMPPKGSFVPVLTIAPAAAWEDLSRRYANVLAGLAEPASAVADKAKQLAAGADTAQAAEAIYSFVTRSIRTVPVPQRAFGLTPHGSATILEQGIGNELDKNFLFHVMLKGVGIPSEFTLVRERQEGPIAEDAPCLKAFNRSAVRLGDGTYITTASDVLSFGTLPGGLQGAPALPARLSGASLDQTQQPAPSDELDHTGFTAKLDTDGALALEVTFSGKGNSGTWMRGFKDIDEQQIATRLRQIAGQLHPGAMLESYEITDMADLTVTPSITLRCTIPDYATRAGGDLMLFRLPALFYDASDVGRPNRVHDLFWPNVEQQVTEGAIQLPKGFRVYSAPEAAKFDSPTASYKASLTADTSIRFSDVYTLHVPEAPAVVYPDYKACKEIRARLPLQRIVLMRKGGGQ